MSTDRRGSDPRRDRGQTSLDFLIGVGVFLATVGFVALFAVDAVTPFADDQSGGLVVERTADELVGVTLAGSGVSTLDGACTLAFFDDSMSDAGCAFTSTDSLTDRVGISNTWDLNVTIERNDPAAGRDVLRFDANGDLQPCAGGTQCLATGAPPDYGSDTIATTTRVAMLGGHDVAVVVRIW